MTVAEFDCIKYATSFREKERPLTAGSCLGSYEILSRLGAGGRGEVYRSSDTRLDREVTLKILPSEFASNAGRRARFEREARAVVSANLDGSPPRELLATERNELMPTCAAKEPALVQVTDRNGPPEIWMRAANSDRPLVTARCFPPGEATQGFMGPALSPNADRVIYARIGVNSGRLWISAVSGGAPTPLTNDDAMSEFPGSWFPDSSLFVYTAIRSGKIDLMKVKTTGQAEPSILKGNQPQNLIPSWSPAGDWIACGQELISPDGKTTRPLGKRFSMHYVFSADGKLAYGIGHDGGRIILFSVNIATGVEKVLGDLGKDFSPSSHIHPGIRFSLAPDGKSFVYRVVKSNLWMLEGFNPKPGLLNRLGRKFN